MFGRNRIGNSVAPFRRNDLAWRAERLQPRFVSPESNTLFSIGSFKKPPYKTHFLAPGPLPTPALRPPSMLPSFPSRFFLLPRCVVRQGFPLPRIHVRRRRIFKADWSRVARRFCAATAATRRDQGGYCHRGQKYV